MTGPTNGEKDRANEGRAGGAEVGANEGRVWRPRRLLPALLPTALDSFYTITHTDVTSSTIRAFGKVWPVMDFLGRILLQDIGKRVYLRGDILQVENHKQFAARLASEREEAKDNPTSRCECGEHTCPLTLDTGMHPAGEVCGLPGVMHLFPLQRSNEPAVFCDGCGDDAMRSGLYASGEDVAVARREAEGWKDGSVPCGRCGLPVNAPAPCANCSRPTAGKPESAERKISRKGQGGYPDQHPQSRQRRPMAQQGDIRHSSADVDRMHTCADYEGVGEMW